MHANRLHHCADGTTGDNACTFRSRFNQHTARAEFSNQLVGYSVLDQGHANQTLFCSFDRLLNRQRNFARLARAKSDVPAFIADDDQRRKRQILAALHDFRNAVDRNHLVFQIKPLGRNTLFGLSHCFSLLCFSFFLRGFSSTASSGAASTSTSAIASSLLSPAARAASVSALIRP